MESSTPKGCNFGRYRFPYYAYLPNPKGAPAQRYYAEQKFFLNNERCPGWYPTHLLAQAAQKRQKAVARARQNLPPWAPAQARALNPPPLAVRPKVRPSVLPPKSAQVPGTPVGVVRHPSPLEAVAPGTQNFAGSSSPNAGQITSSQARTAREGNLPSPLEASEPEDPPDSIFNTESFTSP